MANFNSPEGDIAQIYLSDTEILERYVGNQLWIWGSNLRGQLGTNNVVHRSSPVQTVAGGTNWKQVSTASQNIGFGDAHQGHTAAIKTDGTLWLWGDATDGKLGTNDSVLVHRSSPVQTVAGGTNWKQVSAGSDHTAAIKTDGTLWTWGFNGSSRLGTNDTAARSSPVQTIAGGTNWKQVSCGTSHTAAIKTDGTLWTWGSGSSGELGDNDIVARSSPVQVGADTNWKQVNFSNASSAAIKTDGTLWVWGSNGNGQLGTNDVTSRSSPVQTIAGSTNWKQVSGRHTYTAAIKTDGTLWIWGSGDNGQLGTNDRVHRSSPVQTIAGGTNWKQVSAGGRDYTLAIRDDSADPFRSEPL